MSAPAIVEIKDILSILLCENRGRLSRDCLYDFFVNPTESSCNETSAISIIYPNPEQRRKAVNKTAEKYWDRVLRHKTEPDSALMLGAHEITLLVDDDEFFYRVVDFDDLVYNQSVLKMGKDPISEALLERFRRKECKLTQPTYTDLVTRTLSSAKKELLSFYLKNNWRFFHGSEELQINDDFTICHVGVSLENNCKSSPAVATVSPHVLLVVGTRTITIPFGRELSVAEFERLTQVVKMLTQ